MTNTNPTNPTNANPTNSANPVLIVIQNPRNGDRVLFSSDGRDEANGLEPIAALGRAPHDVVKAYSNVSFDEAWRIWGAKALGGLRPFNCAGNTDPDVHFYVDGLKYPHFYFTGRYYMRGNPGMVGDDGEYGHLIDLRGLTPEEWMVREFGPDPDGNRWR